MFGLLQFKDGFNYNSMVGIMGMKRTTNITVSDLKISEEYYTELIKNCIKTNYKVIFDDIGNFKLHNRVYPDLQPSHSVKNWEFNIYYIVNELLHKAKQFEVNDKLICSQRSITKKSNQ